MGSWCCSSSPEAWRSFPFGSKPLVSEFSNSFGVMLYIPFSFPRFHLELASILAYIAFGAATILLLITREPKARRVSPPCEKVIKQAERTNRRNGHENAGFLSMRAAFSPLVLPKTSLPANYSAWDDVAASLPRLIQNGVLRATVDRMPVLDAQSSLELPDEYLQRAGTILGVLSHAYIRLEGSTSLTTKYDKHSEVLPDALSIPWTQVCSRLGRPGSDASLSYIDLVVYNFTASRGTVDDLTLENSGLLVPTVNNQEERTFYGAMIEINSKVVPILHQVVEAQRAVLSKDTAALKQALLAIIPLLKEVTKTLHKINMIEGSKSHVDPVVWTKTVANLAIPWIKGATGAAGTAHPFFHMMDEFVGRKNYASKIGKEALTVRATFPVHWQRFLEALNQVSVKNFIQGLSPKDKKDLPNILATLEHDYGGNWGLLSIHRRKVYGYLSVSFRIGRNSTINGLGRATQRAKWTEADNELEKARQERESAEPIRRDFSQKLQSKSVFHFSDIIQHNTSALGYWFTSGDTVYDGTGFMSKHPGGKTVIALCSGQDATADLTSVAHLTDPKIRAILDRYRIGKISRAIFRSSSLQKLYDEVAWLGQRIAETENICNVTLTFLHNKMTAVDESNQLTVHKLHHLHSTKQKIREDYATGLATDLVGLLDSFDGVTPDCSTDQARTALARVWAKASTPVEERTFADCDAALRWFEKDLQGMRAMKVLAVTTLKKLESMPFETRVLNCSSARAVGVDLTIIAEEIGHLGD